LGRRAGLGIFLAAAVARVAYIVIFMRHYEMRSDAQHYHLIATSIAHGQGFAADYPYGFDHATAFRPPLYPLLLGGGYFAFGNHIATAQVLNVLIGSTVVLLIAVIAARIAGRPAALVAAGIACVFPPLLENDAVPLSEPLGLLLLLVVTWALLAGRIAWAGLAAGLLVLTRPSAQLLVPLLALVLWRQVGFRRAVAFLVTAIVVATPWVIRNDLVFGRPLIVTSNGFNLAAIYSPIALSAGHFVDPVFDPRFAPIRNFDHSFVNLNEANLDDTFRREGLKGIREHPGEVPGVVWKNVTRLVDATWRLNDDPERADGRPLQFRHWTLPLVWLVEIAGVLSVVAVWVTARRQGRPAGGRLGSGLLPLLALYFFVVSIAVVSVPRLRAPDDVLMIIAIGVVSGAQLAKTNPEISSASAFG
jgi:4-amino-4-deoxy-L-arabinose transferase-like glycosyltransferase